MTARLANNVSGTGLQPAVKINSNGATGTVQVDFSGTGSVQLRGSINGVTFYDVGSAIVASGLVTGVQLYPYMRANITANSGTCFVGVDAIYR